MVFVIFFLDAVQHQHLIAAADIAQGRVSHA
jgi:hypothetical protein